LQPPACGVKVNVSPALSPRDDLGEPPGTLGHPTSGFEARLSPEWSVERLTDQPAKRFPVESPPLDVRPTQKIGFAEIAPKRRDVGVLDDEFGDVLDGIGSGDACGEFGFFVAPPERLLVESADVIEDVPPDRHVTARHHVCRYCFVSLVVPREG